MENISIHISAHFVAVVYQINAEHSRGQSRDEFRQTCGVRFYVFECYKEYYCGSRTHDRTLRGVEEISCYKRCDIGKNRDENPFFRNGHVVFSYESGNKIQHNEPYDVVAVAHGKLRDYVNVAGKYTENDRHDAYCQVRLFFYPLDDNVEERRNKHHEYVCREKPVFAAYNGKNRRQKPFDRETFNALYA